MVKHVVRPKICELLRLRESQKSQCFQGVSAFFKILDLKSVVCTRNWRDTTFATPRRIYLPEYYNTRNAVCQMVLEKNFILCASCIFVPHGWCAWVQKRVACECFGGFWGCFLPFVAFWRLPAQARAFARGYWQKIKYMLKCRVIYWLKHVSPRFIDARLDWLRKVLFMLDTVSEIKRRRTFAIISHPDAGKTTLTEKFLLYGGAIQSAGSVKGKQNDKHADRKSTRLNSSHLR